MTARLTDTSKYTGSHKNRFDSDGRGKGIDGRADRVANDGYVQGYKGMCGAEWFGIAMVGCNNNID